ncbi:MAG TPA: hypothetical protein VG916_06320 [Gemmatimonadaceae bacterium]|nr:hypothetical protein [Gemmatimonadaceae bacterium]
MHGLSDVMGASGLAGYAIVALLLFCFAFVLVAWTIYAPSARADHEHDALLPFDDGSAPSDTRGTVR